MYELKAEYLGWIQVALTVSELEIKSFVQDAETKLKEK